MTTRLARCTCGQLRLTITVEPEHVHICTCTRCQQATGSVGGWNGWFKQSGVKIEGSYTRYAYDRSEAVDVQSYQCFCPICGSGGFGVTGEYLTDCYVLPMGSLATPENPAPVPTMVHFYGNRPQWVDHLGDLPGAS